ncbi:restriction endonuclease fold toxin, partial [Paenibacillus macerans]
NVVGFFLPFKYLKAVKTPAALSKLSPTVVRSMTAGAIFGTATEASDAVTDFKNDGDQDLTGRAQNIALDTAMAGAGDVTFTYAFKLVSSALKSTAGQKLTEWLKRSEVDEVPATQRKLETPASNNVAEGAGDAASRLVSGKGIYTQYSGGLKQSAKEDAGADLLAEKLGGQSRMIFNNDPKGREFDVVSDQYIGQTKTSMNSLSSQFREQAKATIEAAIETGRKAYFHFETAPVDNVIRQLREYEKRYDVEIIIDISPF